MSLLWNVTKKIVWHRNIGKIFSFSTESKEKLIYVDSQKINYLKIGRGPKNIVCFPGALGTIWSDFKPQIEDLNKDEFTIIVWEQPGHGQSRPPERTFNSNFYHEDADIGYKFVKALGLKSFSLLGWSDGGTAGLILAAKYPEIVDNLVVWGSNSYITSEDFEQYKKIQDIDSWSDNVKAPLVELYGEKVLCYLHKSMFEANRAIVSKGGDISTSLVKLIKCPTLILHGEKDPLVDSKHPQYLYGSIKGAKLHLFPEGKHNIHLRYASEFNQIVTRFLLDTDTTSL